MQAHLCEREWFMATRVLLVDDDHKIISLLKRGLAYEGFEVYTAFDGEAGLIAAKTYQRDLVLLDITMPGVDGFEVCRRLRLLDDIAIIMLTARDDVHALRVQARERPDEINSLAQTMNGMLNSLESAYRDVQNVNDLQRRFLADVSHELRTPLTIMLSSLDLMKKERGGDPEFQA